MQHPARILILAAVLGGGSAALQAAERPADLDKDSSHQVECRSIVLVGGPPFGLLVCKTPREWAEIERAARTVLV
jgi:hypothetical protein